MKKICSSVVIFSLSFLLGACKKATTELNALSSLSGFSVDSNSIPVTSKTSSQFVISGHCKSQYTDVQISVDGGTTWVAFTKAATSSSIQCASGTYSANFSLANAAIFDSSKWTLAGAYPLMIKGISQMGSSDYLSVNLALSGGGLGAVTAGGGLITGGLYKLQGAILSTTTAPTSNGGNYKISGEVQWN